LRVLLGRLDFFLDLWLGLRLLCWQPTPQPLVNLVSPVSFLLPVDGEDILNRMVGQEHRDDILNELLVLSLADEQSSQRTVKHDLDHLVDPLKLVAAYLAGADPLRDPVLLAHNDHLVLQFRVLLDNILAAEGASLVHIQQAFDNVVEFLTQGHEVEMEGFYLLPVFGLEHVKLLLNVKLIFELTVVAEKLLYTFHVHDEFGLEGGQTEVRDGDSLFDHHVYVVEVEVGLEEVSQGHCNLFLDGTEVNVGGLHVLHVTFIPLLHHLDRVGFIVFVIAGIHVFQRLTVKLCPDVQHKVATAIPVIQVASS